MNLNHYHYHLIFSMTQSEKHPVQTVDYKGGKISSSVTLLAYEVYKVLFGEQQELITDGCRGGFGTNELIALLYARNFSRNEWRCKFNEAIDSMEHI